MDKALIEEAQARQRESLAVLERHGGYEHVVHCPTHKFRRCADWVEAWAEYEKALDDERAARGHARHYVYGPRGNATW